MLAAVAVLAGCGTRRSESDSRSTGTWPPSIGSRSRPTPGMRRGGSSSSLPVRRCGGVPFACHPLSRASCSAGAKAFAVDVHRIIDDAAGLRAAEGGRGSPGALPRRVPPHLRAARPPRGGHGERAAWPVARRGTTAPTGSHRRRRRRARSARSSGGSTSTSPTERARARIALVPPHAEPIELTWLGGPEVEQLALADDEIVDAVEAGLRAQGLGQTTIEPRVHLEPDRGAARPLQRAARLRRAARARRRQGRRRLPRQLHPRPAVRAGAALPVRSGDRRPARDHRRLRPDRHAHRRRHRDRRPLPRATRREGARAHRRARHRLLERAADRPALRARRDPRALAASREPQRLRRAAAPQRARTASW